METLKVGIREFRDKLASYLLGCKGGLSCAVARMEQALREGHEKLNAELERMRQRKHQLEAKLARLVNAIAEG
jgi:predicted nuclease with TOPRIM domain